MTYLQQIAVNNESNFDSISINQISRDFSENQDSGEVANQIANIKSACFEPNLRKFFERHDYQRDNRSKQKLDAPNRKSSRRQNQIEQKRKSAHQTKMPDFVAKRQITDETQQRRGL